MNICKAENCMNKVKARNLCSTHYRQLNLYGEIFDRNNQTPNDFIIEGNICKIGLYNRKCKLVGYTIIDVDDVERCKLHKWCLHSNYVVIGVSNIHLHHFILQIKSSMDYRVDHINRNPLDNRKENLRICSNSENCNNAGNLKIILLVIKV